ncbi:MAG: DUF4296 domain-containing protein [bacterium]
MLLFSCSGEKEINKKYLIPREDFIHVLTDIHLADAMFISYEVKQKFKLSDSISYYGPILDEYGYTKQQLDSTLVYYSEHPGDYDKVYDEVLNKLSRLEGDIKNIEEEKARKLKLQNLWNRKENWELPAEGDKNTIDFKVPLKGAGIYTIQADILIYKNDRSLKPRISASFINSDTNTSVQPENFQSGIIKKDEKFHTVIISGKIHDSSDYTHLIGSILDHTPREGHWKKHAEIRNIRIYYDPETEK